MQSEPPRRGQRLGAYIVEAPVGEGAMARVYQARHAATGREVAVKVLHARVARDEVAVERFRREYETASSLNHDRIVEVLDFGQTVDGAYFMTMEYLEGEELSLMLEKKGALEPARVVRIVCQLALGLHHAHADGVVHRDLKPENIFVSAGEGGVEVSILDFGSVKLQVVSGRKLTALGTTLGSPRYMSPEQAMGKLDVDQRTDVFALAAIVHELATGQVAFGGDEVAEILMKILAEDPPPVSTLNRAYSWAFDDVVKKGLHKDKARRFGSTVELAEAVLRALGLDADVEKWARRSEDTIREALESNPDATDVPSVPPMVYPTSIPAPLPRRSSLGVSVLTGALMFLAVVAIVWAMLS
ncbi:MAG: serine/threonine protein kinase [Myxococcales bacterium]|nr:serine/threonine protein kinase [Myxococcales bacterium]MDH3843124.1 serine/threonine protein kinase [Myxococcales bacterium]